MNIRIGHGYDVHRLVKNRKLILGGVDIEHEFGLFGHSDADVLLHSICDALLGALALGDIGKHFPCNDDNYKDISSLILLEKTYDLIKSKGYKIGNIDVTVIAQEPHLSTYILAIRENISKVLNTSIENISVKATTEEGLGFTGTKEGIASHCVALLLSE